MDKLRLFSTQADYEDEVANLEYPTVSYIEGTEEVLFIPEELKYKVKYLTFEALEDGTFTLTIPGNNYGVSLGITSISYSIDGGDNWVTTQRSSNSTTTITTPTIPQGGKVLWKGIATSLYGDSGPGVASIFSSTGDFNVYGNIMSLLYGDAFKDKVTLPNNSGSLGNFGSLFKDAVNLIDAENLIMPATTLSQYCYNKMFYGCTSLTTAPKLPATNLNSRGEYAYMFYNCTSLTTAPALPATTIGLYSYQYMFYGCTSLTTAPSILPPTALTENCYQNMFYGCTSLTTAPVLPATTLASSSCYSHMFYGCTSLNYIKAMFTTTPSTSYTQNWVQGVAGTGTFVKNSAAQWDVTGVYGVPSGWTVQTASE